LTGGPISDHRILSADDREVTFLAREGSRVGGTREQVPLTLSTEEFVRRWCLHIQPHQLTKTRCFGGWANSKHQDYRQRMESALAKETKAEQTTLELKATLQEKRLCCESCSSKSLRLSKQQSKPSWSVPLGLDSQCSPWWYAESQEREEKRLWDEAMGEGFYDWYVAHVLRPSESARDLSDSSDSASCPPVQLLLPGIGIDPEKPGDFYADSF
jgi:hypothetical protein